MAFPPLAPLAVAGPRELYETTDVRPKRLELYPVLIDNLEALDRYAEALVAMREFKALSDEVTSTESQTRIGELENTLDVERKNRALADAEAANELTGLGNRRQLLEAIAEPANFAGQHLLVMLDLDHFKRINDSHGYDAGDRALQQFADTLRAVARQGDLLVRWGGEEFVWACRGADADQGPTLCERLLRQMREQPFVEGTSNRVTASLGYVPLPTWEKATPDWEAALRIADYAVYCTKARGRDGWTGFVGRGSAAASPAEIEERGVLRRVASGPAVTA